VANEDTMPLGALDDQIKAWQTEFPERSRASIKDTLYD
jgi:hypothetical protein